MVMKYIFLLVRYLWVSFDEGYFWDKYGFILVFFFVDGVLVEVGMEIYIMIVFGYFSFCFEW